jgi:putative transposase
MAHGFLYLVAIIDWAELTRGSAGRSPVEWSAEGSRAVLAWRLSNTIDASFCVEALEEARARHGKPRIFNTDQGAPFTSAAFTGKLEAAGVAISHRIARRDPLRIAMGRARAFHGQHFHRTPVALDQV